MRTILTILTVTLSLGGVATYASAAEPKSKFYDFSDQLIDGEVRRPTAIYTNERQQAQFDRMLSLKKERLPLIFEARKERVFK